MNFDISKLETTQSKATEKKAKPRFGPAARARPKAQVKPAEPREETEPVEAPTLQPAGAPEAVQQEPAAVDRETGNNADLQAAEQTDKASSQAEAVAAPTAEAVLAQKPSNAGRKFKPSLGKRKAAEPAAAAEPSQQAPDANQEGALALATDTNAAEDAAGEPDEAGPSTGPMTKAKKRKGLGKGTGAAPKQPKVPLAEQPIDVKTMPMKTILKCAWAKDKRKISAEQAVREAAGLSPGSGSHQQPARAPRAETAGGTIQVQVDEHGGIIVDNASRTVQAPPEEFIRREDGEYDVINSMTYMKREASSRWSAEETEEFYAALAIWGTNFNYVATRINTRMAALGVPHADRSRRQVKLKFNKEEKLHPKKIDRALKGQRAEAEDYVEIIHELKAQNQEEEMAYLEAAPSSKPEPTNDVAADTDLQGNASTMPADEAEYQAASQAAAPPVSTSGLKQDNGPQKIRPRAKPRPQTGQQKTASANAAEGPSQQQESAPDGEQSRFTQMLQESGVTVADWQDEGVY